MKASVRFVGEAGGIAVIAVLMVMIGVRYLSPAPTTPGVDDLGQAGASD